VAQAVSACHWNWIAMGEGQRPTEGDSHLRGTQEPDRQATDVRAPRSWTQRGKRTLDTESVCTCTELAARSWSRAGRRLSLASSGAASDTVSSTSWAGNVGAWSLTSVTNTVTAAVTWSTLLVTKNRYWSAEPGSSASRSMRALQCDLSQQSLHYTGWLYFSAKTLFLN